MLFNLFLFLLVNTSQASPNQTCEFKLDCENHGAKFSIQFKSVSGDCNEDDMAAIFEANGVTKTLQIKKDWYFYTDHIAKTQPSVCKSEGHVSNFAAYAIEKNLVLLFLKSTGRPGYDRINAMLLNTSSGEVIDFKSIGSSKNNYLAVLKTKKGFRTRIVRDSLSFHKQVTCDCDAPFVDDWMEVTVSGGKIKTDWKN